MIWTLKQLKHWFHEASPILRSCRCGWLDGTSRCGTDVPVFDSGATPEGREMFGLQLCAFQTWTQHKSKSVWVCMPWCLAQSAVFFLCSNTPVLLCSSLSCMFVVSPCECSFFCCTLSLSQFSHFRYLRFAVRKLWRLEHLWRRGTAMENSLRTCVWMRQRTQHFHLIRITCSLHQDLLGISTLDLMRKMPRPTTKKVGCVYCYKKLAATHWGTWK